VGIAAASALPSRRPVGVQSVAPSVLRMWLFFGT
jgi:hypothetical protein